jgi:hypothetical protein
MSSMLLSGVRISFRSGLSVSAQVREANRLTKVVRDKWGWRCECQQADCRHIRAVRALTRGS